MHTKIVASNIKETIEYYSIPRLMGRIYSDDLYSQLRLGASTSAEFEAGFTAVEKLLGPEIGSSTVTIQPGNTYHTVETYFETLIRQNPRPRNEPRHHYFKESVTLQDILQLRDQGVPASSIECMSRKFMDYKRALALKESMQVFFQGILDSTMYKRFSGQFSVDQAVNNHMSRHVFLCTWQMDNKEIVSGIGTLDVFGDHGCPGYIVHDRFMRQGIATRLLDRICRKSCLEMGAAKVDFEIKPNNILSHTFYLMVAKQIEAKIRSANPDTVFGLLEDE